jgi:hypothetical protein
MDNFKNKYIKYKNKYLEYKCNQQGGVISNDIENNIIGMYKQYLNNFLVINHHLSINDKKIYLSKNFKWFIEMKQYYYNNKFHTDFISLLKDITDLFINITDLGTRLDREVKLDNDYEHYRRLR